MKKIFKYNLQTGVKTVMIPEGSEILCVKRQLNEPVMYALVDPDKPERPIQVCVYGTGHPIPDDNGRYIGTIMVHGIICWHIFVIEEASNVCV